MRKRSWRPLLVTVAAGLYFLVAVSVVLPHYRAGGSPFVDRYSAYGSGMEQIARTILLHPIATARGLATRLNARYFWQLLWPFGLTPLVSPLTTLIALPEYLLNGLSSVVPQHHATNHYVAAEVPFLFAGALLGIARIGGWIGRRHRALSRPVAPPARTVAILAGLLLCACLAGNYLLGPLPFGLPGAKASPSQYRMTAKAAVTDRAIRLIPADAVVSAQNRIGSHLSARRVIYLYPYIGNARYVVFDSRLFGPHPRARAVAHELARNLHYMPLFSHDGVTVYQRLS